MTLVRASGLFLLVCGVMGAVASAQGIELTPAQRAAGWTVLFDGKSTEHWRGYRQTDFPENGWVVEDGALHVVAGGGGGDIITRKQYENFEFVVEWRVAERGNSGIIYCVQETDDTSWQSGPEYQILDDVGAEVAADDLHAAGSLYDLYKPAVDKVLKPQGEYNRSRIIMREGVVEHWLNGMKLLSADMNSAHWTSRVAGSKFNIYDGFGKPGKGHIALQEHGSDIWFRNIMIRDLDAPMPDEITLFNGANLEGWSAHLRDASAAMKDVWSIEQGVLICKGNPIGYIYTDAMYDNFVLKIQWRFNPETMQAGNSGVLLRRTGEHMVWPKSIEAQLNSGTAGDIFGIGGFVYDADGKEGRHTPRKVTAENPVGEWNEYEIIADGETITMIINGKTVNVARNAEKGPGQICLQAEGVEIQFRDVRLAPIR